MLNLTYPHQLAGSAASAILDQSPLPLPGTPSPGSSSASTGSGSGSGKSTDTIKRGGASPSSVKHVKIQESSSSYSITQKKPTKDSPTDDVMSLLSGTAATTATTTRKGVEFFEPHKPHTKSDDSSYTMKYGELAAKRLTAYGDPSTYGTATGSTGKTALATLSTDDYKAMRNKSSATSSSSSSQATVLSAAGSTATSATTTSSDDSDDLISYKSSASTNALLAQSQAMTTSQLMSKYLKREPRVQFTPIKSPDSPSPPGSDGLPKGVYHLTAASSKTGTSTGAISKHTDNKSASPSKQLSGSKEGPASTTSSNASYTAPSTSFLSTATSATYNDSKSVASSHISNKQQSSELRSYGSSLFGSSAQIAATNGNGATTTNGTHNAMHLYGTLPKNGTAGNATGNGSSGGAGGGMYNSATSASYYAGAQTSSSSGGPTASSSGVSSMTGSTTSYDYYNTSSASYTSATSTRSYGGNGGGGGGGGNYHTLGSYRVQYAATNPFLEAFDAPGGSSVTLPAPVVIVMVVVAITLVTDMVTVLMNNNNRVTVVVKVTIEHRCWPLCMVVTRRMAAMSLMI
ncbi:unnamed protein product [Ceratitis capitata]|uniref:(Mediterranean fruit fly) hypothetical protein n=1 Tax=Ceratitis capitata TaxID=7213 RepID=A0A811UAF1_CERCA|nr:unnamed protein product [Ceratitis capitata]